MSILSVKKPEPKSNHVINNNKAKRPNENADNDESPSRGTLKHIEYNPISGVTFRENKNSDVQIVGKGYGDDPTGGDGKVVPPMATAKLKEKRRLNNRGK